MEHAHAAGEVVFAGFSGEELDSRGLERGKDLIDLEVWEDYP